MCLECADTHKIGVRIRGTFGDIDPLNKVRFKKRATSRAQKGPLEGVSLIPPRIKSHSRLGEAQVPDGIANLTQFAEPCGSESKETEPLKPSAAGISPKALNP